jgi:peptidoglycan hydrolase-like protein with peptidoglycan-binding domain
VPNGADVEAVKRAISRAGFFPWQEFDRAYNEKIADAVVEFQKKNGLGGDSGGAFGEPTFSKLKQKNVPSGSPNAGEDCFDKKAADLYKGYKPPADDSKEKVRST